MHPRVPVIGNSHAKAILSGAQRLEEAAFRGVVIRESKCFPRFDGIGSEVREVMGGLVDRLLQGDAGRGIVCVGGAPDATPAGSLFCAIGGNAHLAMAISDHSRPFDFYDGVGDSASQVDSAAEIIPFAAIKMTLSYRIKAQLMLLDLIAEHSGVPVVHVQSPPPPRSNAYVKANLDDEFTGGNPVDIASPAVRLKLYRLHSSLFAEHCARKGIDVIPSPEEACDSDGYLLPEYCAEGSCAHANTDYGELVSRQILARCS